MEKNKFGVEDTFHHKIAKGKRNKFQTKSNALAGQMKYMLDTFFFSYTRERFMIRSEISLRSTAYSYAVIKYLNFSINLKDISCQNICAQWVFSFCSL